MKKVIMVFAMIALMAGPANAGSSLIGLYVDEGHSVCRHDIPAPYTSWTTWVWVLPGDNGMICAEFKIELPSWVLNIGTIPNGVISVALGDPITGVSTCFSSCQTDWNWLYQMNCLPTNILVGYMNIVEHPDVGTIQAANCLPDYPLEPLIVFNNLGLNQDCQVEVAGETSSWGAIKGMYIE